MASTGSGEWLEKALLDICKNIENGLDLDSDLISGLVSFCELAPPEDAQQYLNNIVGQEAGQSVIEEYMQRRGYIGTSTNAPNAKLHAYVKPPPDEGSSKVQVPISRENKAPAETSENRNTQKVNPTSSKKKKSGKVISLAEAAKGSVVFQQGKPCACQASRYKLVSNCLSCGKIVCGQEGEGPCSFCGALVLREGSNYAGLDESFIPLSEAEATTEAFAKRLVDYDRNSAARTTVIDDQSDYYEIEGNSWLSKEDIEEADKARRNKVVMTFDLVGRKEQSRVMAEGSSESVSIGDSWQGPSVNGGLHVRGEEYECSRFYLYIYKLFRVLCFID
ncbi:hypothetical protein MKX01_026671 [Papaver californicum]|nr:hypothetical protein MKX01_026671 [Papaver californicum]